MNVTDTKPLEKCCSKCGELKSLDRIVKNRNICKDCCNLRKKERLKEIVVDENQESVCRQCNQTKMKSCFIQRRNMCKDCNNENRRGRYHNDEDLRKKLIKQRVADKQKKAAIRRQIKLDEIGEGNKKCSVCSEIKPKEKFRYNRLKCRTCERDEPLDKFKRNVRSRIYLALMKHKQFHTIKYLGCTTSDYLQWILSYNVDYNLDNHGKVWHIDHVIPLSKFNLDDYEQQMIAFNWRNTMPLSAKENLSKNSKIIIPQIQQHSAHLLEYHKEKKIDFPQTFIDLFAKHLDAGTPLEPSLPLTLGNFCEELG